MLKCAINSALHAGIIALDPALSFPPRHLTQRWAVSLQDFCPPQLLALPLSCLFSGKDYSVLGIKNGHKLNRFANWAILKGSKSFWSTVPNRLLGISFVKADPSLEWTTDVERNSKQTPLKHRVQRGWTQ